MRLKLLFLFSIISLISYSQKNPLLDSLTAVLQKNCNDTIKVQTYIKIGDWYYSVNIDSSNFYTHKALNLAQQIKYLKGVSSAYYLLGKCASNQGNNSLAIDYFNAILNISQVNLKDRSKVFSALGVIYNNLGEWQRAIDMNQKSFEVKQSIKDSSGMPLVLIHIGSIYYDHGDYANALILYQKAINIAELIKDSIDLARGNDAISTVYFNQKMYSKSLYYAKK